MIIEVDSRAPIPPYEQIRRQILALVASGELSPGTRLPTIRQLSGDLGVAPNTVARAFRELEASGVLSSRRRHGTSVTEEAAERARALGGAPSRPVGTRSPAGPDSLDAAALAYTEHARLLGATEEEAVRALRRAWQQG
jgi:DNA-binding transcriptional regulator YhcF (GntR family)